MTRRNARKQGWVFPLFSPDTDDRLSLNFHRFVIWYRSCGTQSVGLGQHCLPKVSNGFNHQWCKNKTQFSLLMAVKLLFPEITNQLNHSFLFLIWFFFFFFSRQLWVVQMDGGSMMTCASWFSLRYWATMMRGQPVWPIRPTWPSSLAWIWT